jgi:IrrE N-terminal-like domain
MSITTPKPVSKPRISEAVGYGRSDMEPGRDAWELLKQVWLKGPTTITLPVDPVAIGEDLEIEVLWDDELAPEVSSVLRKALGSGPPRILLNPIDGLDRRRFPCALALGHYSRCVELGLDGPWDFIEGRDFLSRGGLDDDQAYALKFAEELLMPRVALREVLDTRSVVALATFFGVPGDVMSHRLGRVGMGAR